MGGGGGEYKWGMLEMAGVRKKWCRRISYMVKVRIRVKVEYWDVDVFQVPEDKNIDVGYEGGQPKVPFLFWVKLAWLVV